LCRDLILTWATAVQLSLNLRVGDVDLRWATVNYDANAATVRLAKRRNAKKLAKGVAHGTKR
jgi:hypothetical protein